VHLLVVFRAAASCMSPEIKKPRLDQWQRDYKPQVVTYFLSSVTSLYALYAVDISSVLIEYALITDI